MNTERKPDINIRNTEISTNLSKEDVRLVEAWSSVYKDISMVALVSEVAAIRLDFSNNIWDGRFYMKVRPVEQESDHEPNSINTFLYLSPNGEGPRGLLLETVYTRAEWIDGKPSLKTTNIQKQDPELPSLVFSELEMANAARKVVMHGMDFSNPNSFNQGSQTDLMS